MGASNLGMGKCSRIIDLAWDCYLLLPQQSKLGVSFEGLRISVPLLATECADSGSQDGGTEGGVCLYHGPPVKRTLHNI
jgi:hypothetical protein